MYKILIFLLLLPMSGFTKTPVHYQKWQIDDTTFSKQIGGAVRNYQRPDKAWDSIVNGFELEGDSVVFVEKSVLRARVNKDNGVSKIMLTWDGQEYTVTQKMLGIGWIKISTRQSQWIDSTMNWGNFSVDSNICKWTGISPAVDYRVLKDNGRVAHGIFYKPAFLDSAVTLYNQRADSLDIALANVMVYTLSGNIDDADSAVGDLRWRRLKDFGYYSFNLRNQWLRFPGSDTLRQIPVRQYWERRGTKIVCIEYVMMSRVKQVHEAYPSATVWHNDSKTISGTTNVEDAVISQFYSTRNYGGATGLVTGSTYPFLMRVKNVASEIGADATISAAVCSLYSYGNSSGNMSNYRIFKPWEEGTQNDVTCSSPGCSWVDWACTGYEWTTPGCLCANDDGVDNSDDDGDCSEANERDRKATAEDTEALSGIGWYALSVSAGLAQDWYDGTANENGVLVLPTGTAYFYSTEYTTDPSKCPFWTFTYTTGEPAAAGQMIMIQ